jgi:hypothetical protein
LLKIVNIVGTVKERLFNLMATNPRCEFWARVQYGITHNTEAHPDSTAAKLTNEEADSGDDDIIDEFLHRPPLRETKGGNCDYEGGKIKYTHNKIHLFYSAGTSTQFEQL